MGKGKIEKEKDTIRFMIDLYCRKKLKTTHMPEEYIELAEYATNRLDRCKFGDKKSSCKKCPIHCYKKDKREKIRTIMRWAGPRMLFYTPIAAIKHMLGR